MQKNHRKQGDKGRTTSAVHSSLKDKMEGNAKELQMEPRFRHVYKYAEISG
jgi:hypothetical protein